MVFMFGSANMPYCCAAKLKIQDAGAAHRAVPWVSELMVAECVDAMVCIVVGVAI